MSSSKKESNLGFRRTNHLEPTIRLGLCCAFANENIRFRTITATLFSRLSKREGRTKLRDIVTSNARSLNRAIEFCFQKGIGSFRVGSQILPLKTHPQYGYQSDLLGEEIVSQFRGCRDLAVERGIRLTFHPDQFVVLNSPKPQIVSNGLAEIEYQAEVAEWIGADVINVHAGGGYGDKEAALNRLGDAVGRLSRRAFSKLSLENDDRVFTPFDLIPVCRTLHLPFVYDVHHHRCNDDDIGIEETTAQALSTWNREPLFHVSSPRDGWDAVNPRYHSDYVDANDFPLCWNGLNCTVEVEAKAKELAVQRLMAALREKRDE